MDSNFDVAVLGAGPGGYVAAIRAAQLGLNTCLIDKREVLGGTCLNVGCIPSKALLESSELALIAREGLGDHGIDTRGVSVDIPRMMKRKEEIVSDLTNGLKLLMRKNKITVVHGVGRVTGPNRIRVDTRDIDAKAIILATGSLPVEIPFMPFDGKNIVSSTEALSFEKVPKHLIVVGAGAVGLELGSVWRRLGARVTVIERLPRAVPQADEEMSKALTKALKAQGIDFHFGANVSGAKVMKSGIRVSYRDAEGASGEIKGDRVLVSVGRRAAITEIGLEQVAVEVREGKIAVDGAYRTSVPTIYAIGDAIAGPMLAHKAEDEGVAVAEILAGKPGHVNYNAIPNVVYTDPELADVGLSEAAAKAAGYQVAVGRFRYAANARARTLGASSGLVKLVTDAKNDRIIGAHICGVRASDMIAELVVALEFGASAEDIARTVHAHPTLAEIVKEAALAVDKRALHA